jgi:hypothetical protein
LVLFAVRRAAGSRIEPRLRRIEDWLNRRTGGSTAWIVGILGVLVAADAIAGLVIL